MVLRPFADWGVLLFSMGIVVKRFEQLLDSCWVVECQEIGLVAFMFFIELLFSYVSLAISLYVSLY